ncbi:MAG: hypothetical protein Q8J93_03115, partial [Xanthomonadales bacterium]|nr:hypothetical protein [Xanthomonadales bacterium]
MRSRSDAQFGMSGYAALTRPTRLPDRLAVAGFNAAVLLPSPHIPWQLGRCVLLAHRPEHPAVGRV